MHQLLDTPIYLMCVAESTMLEWKFGPTSRRLVEMVLVNAPALRRESGSLLRNVVVVPAEVRWSGSAAGETFDQSEGMEVVARDGCLVVRLSTEPVVRWRGSSPVLLGEGSSGGLVAMAVMWDSASRDLVLGVG